MVESFVVGAPRNSVVQNERKPKEVYTIEEAIEEAKMGKCQIILIFLTGLALMGTVIENMNISYILPYAKCDLNLTTGEQGMLGSISFLGVVCTSHVWGFVADIWGRQKVIRTALIGGCIFSLLSAFSVNTYVLIILRFIAGAFLAGSQAGTMSYISEFHSRKWAPIAVSIVSIFMSLVWLYTSSIAIFLIPMNWSIPMYFIEFKPWRLYLIFVSMLNIWNAIAFSVLPESPKFLLVNNRKEEAIDVLSRIYAMNTGKSKNEYPVKDISHTVQKKPIINGCLSMIRLLWAQTKPIFQAPLLTHTWKMCYIIFVIFSIGHGLFMWFPDFMTQVQNYDGVPKTLCEIVGGKRNMSNVEDVCNSDNSNTTIFKVMFLVGAFFIVISVLSSYCMKVINPKILVCGWLLVSMIACILMNYTTKFYPIFLNFNIFLSCCTSANVIMAVSVNLYPTQYCAMATSFILMCGRLGGVTGSNIVGFPVEDNCDLIFYAFGAVLITCTFFFVMIKTNPENKPRPSIGAC